MLEGDRVHRAEVVDPFADHNIPAHSAVQRVLGLHDDSRFIHKIREISEQTAIDLTYKYLAGCDRKLIEQSMDRMVESRPWFAELL